MRLNIFIAELEKISKSVDNPAMINVEMVDCIPVVKPILKDGTVYITDIDPDMTDDEDWSSDIFPPTPYEPVANTFFNSLPFQKLGLPMPR